MERHGASHSAKIYVMFEGPCSACGRTNAQATKFFGARNGGKPGISLCNHCVAECAMAMEDAPTRIPGGQHHCDYCGKPDDAVAVIVGVGAKKVCDECVEAFQV